MASIPKLSRLRADLHQIVTIVAAAVFFKKTADFSKLVQVGVPKRR
jgi:hypothetical protein